MATLSAYVGFSGNCRAAMSFYKECLGGELFLQTVAESPISSQMPPDMGQSILHSALTGHNWILMATDMGRSGGIAAGSAISLALNCESEEEINRFFENLSQGGQITHPLKAEFWGAIFGQITDKYGISWMLNHMNDSAE